MVGEAKLGVRRSSLGGCVTTLKSCGAFILAVVWPSGFFISLFSDLERLIEKVWEGRRVFLLFSLIRFVLSYKEMKPNVPS